MVGAVGGLLLDDTGESADQVRARVDPALNDAFDGLSPADAAATWFLTTGTYLGSPFRVGAKVIRIRDDSGEVRGTLFLFQPAVGMGVIGTMAFALNPAHLERMASVARASRTPAAILFADLEGSSILSRTLSTANYFTVGRRIVRVADQCVVDAGGSWVDTSGMGSSPSSRLRPLVRSRTLQRPVSIQRAPRRMGWQMWRSGRGSIETIW